MMLVVESTKKVKTVRPKAEVEEMVKKLQKDYEKPVKGKFDFVEAKGGVFSFSDRQFPGTPIMTYHVKHDETCVIPKGVAKRLNNTIQKVRRQKNRDGRIWSDSWSSSELRSVFQGQIY